MIYYENQDLILFVHLGKFEFNLHQNLMNVKIEEDI